MNITQTQRNAFSAALLVAIIAVAVVVALVLLWDRPDGRAQAADTLPSSATPQVSIPASDTAALGELRGDLQAGPHNIDPSLNKRILTGQLDGLIGGALSDSQRAILADGVITFSEYQKASTDWHVCIANAGISVPPMHLNGVGLYNESIISGPTREALDRAEATCSLQFTGAIDFVWSGVAGPLIQKMAQVQSKALAACVASNASYTANACKIAVSKATDTTAFFGGDPSSPPPPP